MTGASPLTPFKQVLGCGCAACRSLNERTRTPFWTHKRVSILKSVVRLVACLAGVVSFAWFAIGFAVAEGLGVWEELGGRG